VGEDKEEQSKPSAASAPLANTRTPPSSRLSSPSTAAKRSREDDEDDPAFAQSRYEVHMTELEWQEQERQMYGSPRHSS